eukprot:Clim_evm50s235 gene=Clim_evmTU50s235
MNSKDDIAVAAPDSAPEYSPSDGTDSSASGENDAPQKISDDVYAEPKEKGVSEKEQEANMDKAAAMAITEIKESEKEESEEKTELVGTLELFKYADKTDYMWISIGLLGAGIHGVVLPMTMFLLGEVFQSFGDFAINPVPDSPQADKLLEDGREYGLYFTYLAIGALVGSYLQVAGFKIAAENQGMRMRKMYFDKVLRMNMGWFDEHTGGELTSRISTGVNDIQDGINDKFALIIQGLATLFAGLVIAFVSSWRLTLFTLALMPALLITGTLFTKSAVKSVEEGLGEYGGAGALAEQVFYSIRTVAAFGAEQKEIDRYKSKLVVARKAGIKKALYNGLGFGSVMLVMFVIYGAVFYYASRLIKEGKDGVDGTISAFFSVIVASFSLTNCTPSFEALMKARASAKFIFDIMDSESSIDPLEEDSSKISAEQLRERDFTIELKDVKFAYPTRKEQNALDGVTIHVKAGEHVALVGASGSGKSTIVGLLERFYDIDEGEMKVCGYPIQDVHPAALRNDIGYVGQEPVLFNMSIAENIKLGKPGASDKEVEESAKLANAHKFISKLPDGYNTNVGTRGGRLSGGQKQRIAIARAIISNPKLLILDEATSALDSESEEIVQKAIDQASNGRTSVTIAHRLQTIRNADCIYVMAQGKVIESGNHEELTAKGGVYAELAAAGAHRREKDISDVDSDELLLEEEEERARKMASIAKDRPQSSKKISLKSRGSINADGELEVLETPKGPLSRVAKDARPEWYYYVPASITSAIQGIAMPAFGLAFSEILSTFTDPTSDDYDRDSLIYSMAFVVIGVVSGFANFASPALIGTAGEKLTERLRGQSFEKLVRMDIAFYDRPENSSGSLSTVLATDASLVQGVFGPRLGVIIQGLAALILALAIGFANAWKLALVILAVVPLMVVAGAIQMKVINGFSSEGMKLYAESGEVITESINGIRTVTSLNAQKRWENAYDEVLEVPYEHGIKASHTAGLGFGVSEFIITGTYGLVFWYSSILVADTEITYEQMLRTFTAIVFTAITIGQLNSFAPDYGKAVQATARIYDLLDHPCPLDPLGDSGGKPVLDKAEVGMQEVHFNYPVRPDVPVLQGINLNVRKGQTIALVGASGCGKSTTVALFERFYDPQKGTVYIDAHKYPDINIKHLRSQFSLVSQEPNLFEGTIRENICYGRNIDEVTTEDIYDVAKQANIHDFVTSLPNGYDTSVGSASLSKMSGGQKQRIAIARALIMNPKVLLLDEATSALDYESEKVVQQALSSASKDRTCVVIAHRLSTVRDADVILVFKEGKIVEKGTHDDLMAKQTEYYNLVRIQADFDK